MNRKGQVHIAVPTALSGVAVVLAVAQAADPVTIPQWAWDIGRVMILACVTAVAWFMRQVFREHKKRIEALERDRVTDYKELDDMIDKLKLSLNTLEAVCPFCEALRRGANRVPDLNVVNDRGPRGSST